MNAYENLRLAFSCVRANKMRSMLTMLGIIIGISAVITISTIGSTLKNSIASSITELSGANQIAFSLSDTSEEYDRETRPQITLRDIYEYQQTFSEDVSDVVIMTGFGEGKVHTGSDDLKMLIIGTTGNALKVYGTKIIKGKDIDYQDSVDRRPVVVVSNLFAKYAFGDKDPLGEKINITVEFTQGSISFEAYIIGIYEYDNLRMGDMMGARTSEKDIVTQAFMPIEYMYDIYNYGESERRVYYFITYTQPGADSDEVVDETVSWFKNTKFPPETTWELQAETMEKILSKIEKILNIVTVAISVIAAISLIVGGIGVMNIMLVSVVERTKEIGIRKALGAKNKVIERQFLVEAILICAFGGIIGILLGMLNGVIISLVAKSFVASTQYSFISVVVKPPVIPIIVSFLFSMLVGVVFGLYPARRAARLSPIDALRYE